MRGRPFLLPFQTKNFLSGKLGAILFGFSIGQLSAQSPEVVLPLSHTAPIYETRFIQNGKYILTLANDNTAKLWDVFSGRLLHSFKDLNHGPSHIRYPGNTTLVSADEKYIFAVTIDGWLKKWELPSARLVFRKKISSYNSALSYAGNLLLVTTSDREKISAEIMDANSGKTLFLTSVSTPANSRITPIVLSPAGKHIFLLEGTTVKIMDMPAGRETGKFTVTGPLVKLAFSGGGDYVYYFKERNDSVFLYNTHTKQFSAGFFPGYVEFSSDGRLLLSNSNRLRLYDPGDGTIITTLGEYDKPSMLGHFTRDDKFIFLTRTNGLIRGTEPYDSITKIWEVASGKLTAELKMNGADISQVVISPDHQFIATTAASTILWDSSGKFIKEFDSRQVVFDPNSRWLAITGDKEVSVFSLRSGQMISQLKGSSNRLVNASLSSDGRQLVTITNEDHVKIWSLNYGRIDHAIRNNAIVQTADFSFDKSMMLLTTADSAKMVDANDGHVLYDIDRKINSARLSPDGKLLIVTGGKQVFIKQAGTGKDLLSFSEDYEISNAALSANGKFAWYIFGQSAAGLIDLSTHRIYRFYLGEENIRHCEFSPDEKLFFLQGENATARLYSSSTGQLYKTLSERSQTEYAVSDLFPDALYLPLSWQGENHVFSGDGKSLLFRNYMDRYLVIRHLDAIDRPDTIFTNNQLVRQASAIPNAPYFLTVTTDDTIRIWQKRSRGYTVVKAIPGNGFKITPDGKFTILVNDAQFSLLETKSLNLLMKAIGMNETDYFTQPGNEAYYMATKNAVSRLTFRYQGDYFSYEQFDLKFNRPDKVLAGIGYANKNLVASYRKAYEKRLRKLGLDPAAVNKPGSTPVAGIRNREYIGYEQTKGEVELMITASDPRSPLAKYNVWVNEVPLYGVAGLPLRPLKKWDTTLRIQLSYNMNVIETSVSNRSGSASYRYPLHLFYQPALATPEKLWFIGIGIDSFADKRYNLTYCVKDIRDLALKLRSKYGAGIEIDTLFNEQVTVNNVAALRKRLLSSSVNDKVILSYSGHGLLSKDLDYYLSTFSVDFSNPRKGGLPYEVLESLLDSIPARKKLMLIDACHSGEIDKEELQRYQRVMAAAGNKGLKGGDVLVIDSAARLGMKNSFELMQEVFVNVGKSTGATIISAAAATQLAQERGDLKNGVFTYSILEFMDTHPTATVTELKNYVNKRVPELTLGLQVPTMRTETLLVDWRVW